MRTDPLKPTAVNSILAEVKELAGKDLVSLMRGEPDFPTPVHIVEAAVSALHKGRTGYPDNRGEMVLRRAVAQKLERDNGLAYDAGAEILVTTGATLGIHAALMALIEKGDEVMLPDPVYDAYQSPIRLAEGAPRSIPAAIENGRFVITPAALEAAWTPACKVLLLNTPWNPVGTVLTETEVAAIADFVERRNLTLISDEIYEAIVYDGRKHVSPARLLKDRTVLVNSLSKSYSMTGWRVGYCAGPKAVIQRMFLILQQSSRGPATFIQDAAAEALSADQSCVAEMAAEYARRRETVCAALSGIKGCVVMKPEGGFFAMVDIRGLGLPSNEVRRKLLHGPGVVVVHGAAYGSGGEGTLRVSFGSGGKTLDNGLARLRQGLESL